MLSYSDAGGSRTRLPERAHVHRGSAGSEPQASPGRKAAHGSPHKIKLCQLRPERTLCHPLIFISFRRVKVSTVMMALASKLNVNVERCEGQSRRTADSAKDVRSYQEEVVMNYLSA